MIVLPVNNVPDDPTLENAYKKSINKTQWLLSGPAAFIHAELKVIWKKCSNYIELLVSHIFMLVSTLFAFKIILVVTEIMFSENHKINNLEDIITMMEAASHIGIVLIFVIYIIHDLMETLRRQNG